MTYFCGWVYGGVVACYVWGGGSGDDCFHLVARRKMTLSRDISPWRGICRSTLQRPFSGGRVHWITGSDSFDIGWHEVLEGLGGRM